ncbi:Hpt domain-containing protein [Paraliomyxa miuraensis]|uniref:Hpt domain-containing protein n=1 Tax=Paraliomyxa miuraensis TaxID=376150 RepID=UPI00224DA2BA|nr:Hpt domain-containing protein [Paraliomyxa miuraensis]MCX4246666.1 Hpt domain-containing protein [Paraliomyxa miuraensis]
MSADPAEGARVQLVELRSRFGARLRERLEQLAALVERAHAGASPEALAEALGAAHRLAGTSGSYGFVDVSEAVAALERALQRITEGEAEWELALASLARAQQAVQ